MTGLPLIWTLILGAVVSSFTGCQQEMASQPSVRPFDGSKFFADGRASRPVVVGTVARGHLLINTALFTGRRSGRPKTPLAPQRPDRATEPEAMTLVALEAEENANFVDELPLQPTVELLEHGYQRYMIYCVVCHDPLGTGHGKIVERGYTPPPSYHVDRLRKAPIGRLFAVASEGYGSMPSYAEQIPVRDRWAIVAYVPRFATQSAFSGRQSAARVTEKVAQTGWPSRAKALQMMPTTLDLQDLARWRRWSLGVGLCRALAAGCDVAGELATLLQGLPRRLLVLPGLNAGLDGHPDDLSSDRGVWGFPDQADPRSCRPNACPSWHSVSCPSRWGSARFILGPIPRPASPVRPCGTPKYISILHFFWVRAATFFLVLLLVAGLLNHWS